eukprot:CAMPEP_0183428152 /NCGR_PEP_ID=MMETSP0370-20130417/44232_1 /TAXON_ID=268820 /ORGANISM="Peridinium aciculiferum, Strain PAER-2" /LENGTH=223 /DNA_ID=CAMNT_0025612879 /DNA_START=32 /DNA_END=701 /DNA_ORIENTATION=+
MAHLGELNRRALSPDRRELLQHRRLELQLKSLRRPRPRGTGTPGTEGLNLPQVSVPAILVVGQNSDLHEMRPHEVQSAANLKVSGHTRWHRRSSGLPTRLRQSDRNPAFRFFQVNDLNLLQIMVRCPYPDRDARRGVGLVNLEIGVDAQLGHPRFSRKLDVDEMWLRAIRLPERVRVAVTQLLYTISRLRRRQRPSSLLPDLAQPVHEETSGAAMTAPELDIE